MRKFEDYRKLFPLTEERTFLDHAALSPYSQRIVDVLDAIKSDYARYGSLTWDKWNSNMETARLRTAELVGCSDDEIACVLNTTDAVLFVLEGAEDLYNNLFENEIKVSLRNGMIRVSPHFYNNREDIDRLMSFL